MPLELSLLDITRNKFPAERTVAIYRHATVSYGQFIDDVARLVGQLQVFPQQRWAIYHEETYVFAVAFFALLHSNKHIVIPGNITDATLDALSEHVDAFIGEMPGATLPIEPGNRNIAIRDINLQPLISCPGQITIFTSGSTGQPKPIAKSLLHFQHEINALEQCWGTRMQQAEIIATVTHQHIYGLIFRVLWPLASGRTFHSERALDPALALREAIESRHGAVWIASPAHLKRLHEHLPWADARQRLKLVFSSGGPLPADAAEQLHQWHGQSATEVYGSSETGGIAWRVQHSVDFRWHPLPGVLVMTDADTRLHVKSPHIDPDLWYATDDSATLHSDGTFTLQGRLDRIVKLEEKRLSLVELEQALLETGWVKEAHTLLLHHDNQHRETLAAVLALNDAGNQLLASAGKNGVIKQLKNALAQHFELSLLPRKWRFVPAIPVNEQAKINHTAVQGLFSDHD